MDEPIRPRPIPHPGPWKWEPSASGIRGHLLDRDGHIILTTDGDAGDDPFEVTMPLEARQLIQAAPEMLALLRDLIAAKCNDSDSMEPGLSQLRAVRAKARALLARFPKEGA